MPSKALSRRLSVNHRFRQPTTPTTAMPARSRSRKTQFTSRTTQSTPRSSETTRNHFSSQRPFLRTTAATTLRSIDQNLESTNQKSSEKDFKDDTTKLGDLATVLGELQKTTVRNRNVTPPSKKAAPSSQTRQKLISTTFTPVFITTTAAPPTTIQVYPTTFIVRQQSPRPFEKLVQRAPPETRHILESPNRNYDYYDEEDDDAQVIRRLPANSKVLLHSTGLIQCLDQGNFPHPASCKKFIYCAKIDNGDILAWQYTCPKDLSFDPVGGICNWAAGLGCNQ